MLCTINLSHPGTYNVFEKVVKLLRAVHIFGIYAQFMIIFLEL